MRIGIVLSSSPGYSESFFKTKINALANSGFQVILFARGKMNQELNCTHIRPYPIFQFPLLNALSVSIIIPFTFLRALRPVVRFWKFEKENGLSSIAIIKSIYLNSHIITARLDWLHFGFATTALGRENVAQAMGAKMAVSFRGYDINMYPVKHPGCYNQLWKRLDKVHSISNYLLQQAYALGLSRNTSYYIISPAVELSELEGKSNFELGDPIQIVTVARLTTIKGLEYGIRAMAKLRDTGLKIQYTIVGDGTEYEKLVWETNFQGLTNEVIFTGKLPHKEVLVQIKNSDFYIQPSLNEGFCNSVLEAQSLGCLCIASNAGALPENIVDGVTGWLVEPRNASALAAGILKVIDLPVEVRQQVAAKAVERAEKKFSIKGHEQEWQKFYS
jgi:colanic acid/amylovoran biosynthesis glycosyltransferase